METIQMKLELVPIPVTDIDRAKAFYVDQVGFDEDHDVQPAAGVRIVQMTPPGSGCSIAVGAGIVTFDELQPGAVRGLHLVVDDIEAARAALVGRGVAVGAVEDMGGVKYAPFSDPDGNTWTLQQIPRGE